VLAGDHCKEASDLGVPLVGVGFMYPQGYFHQSVSADGWQEEIYEKLNWPDTALEPAMTLDGKPCVTAVPLGNRTVLVAVWRVQIGRVNLFLLDTGLEENAPWDRDLSARLYGGDRETRVQQEIVLGIGGVRALKALGIEPAVFHLNEGHAAFAVLQRIRDLCERGSSFEDALDEVRRTTVFTTHTPVAAGHDAFPFQLVETHLSGAWGDLGDYREKFFGLAHYDSGGGPLFNMTALAMRTAGAVNGVSQMHGHVTRQMWQSIWPDTPADRPGCRRSSPASSNGTSDRTGWSVTTIRHSATKCCGFRTRSCGRRGNRCESSCSISSASGHASAGRPKVSPRRGSSRPARCSTTTR
jgi:starch phosphorylase